MRMVHLERKNKSILNFLPMTGAGWNCSEVISKTPAILLSPWLPRPEHRGITPQREVTLL